MCKNGEWEMLGKRGNDKDLKVLVLGRVSSGKTSLVNTLRCACYERSNWVDNDGIKDEYDTHDRHRFDYSLGDRGEKTFNGIVITDYPGYFIEGESMMQEMCVCGRSAGGVRRISDNPLMWWERGWKWWFGLNLQHIPNGIILVIDDASAYLGKWLNMNPKKRRRGRKGRRGKLIEITIKSCTNLRRVDLKRFLDYKIIDPVVKTVERNDKVKNLYVVYTRIDDAPSYEKYKEQYMQEMNKLVKIHLLDTKKPTKYYFTANCDHSKTGSRCIHEIETKVHFTMLNPRAIFRSWRKSA